MAKESLKQKAYSTIKNKILTCEYMPSTFLNEELLSEELQVSRTPIRDALSRLEQEHLIKIIPKKGLLVAPLSIGEITMIFEARLLIEPYIILNYCKNLPSQSLDKMYDNIRLYKESALNNNYDSVFQLDDQFHSIFVNQCTNRYILEAYNSIHNQNSRLRILSGRHDNTRLNDTIDEHIKILDHLVKDDLVNASKAVEEHLIHSKNASFHTFTGNL